MESTSVVHTPGMGSRRVGGQTRERLNEKTGKKTREIQIEIDRE